MPPNQVTEHASRNRHVFQEDRFLNHSVDLFVRGEKVSLPCSVRIASPCTFMLPSSSLRCRFL